MREEQLYFLLWRARILGYEGLAWMAGRRQILSWSRFRLGAKSK
jgi:hypothetical protein